MHSYLLAGPVSIGVPCSRGLSYFSTHAEEKRAKLIYSSYAVYLLFEGRDPVAILPQAGSEQRLFSLVFGEV